MEAEDTVKPGGSGVVSTKGDKLEERQQGTGKVACGWSEQGIVGSEYTE